MRRCLDAILMFQSRKCEDPICSFIFWVQEKKISLEEGKGGVRIGQARDGKAGVVAKEIEKGEQIPETQRQLDERAEAER